jgi:hypothetical protein
MMLLVATTWPFAGGTMVAELAREVREVVDVNVVDPESWLAREAALKVIVLGTLPEPSVDRKAVPVAVL